jgi:hypothetical protein
MQGKGDMNRLRVLRMRRLRTIGFAVVAAVAMGVVSATAAMALEAPELGRCVALAKGKFTNSVCTKKASGTTVGTFEWEPGAVKNKFTGVGATATLETIHKVKVTCKTEASSGEYTSSKTVGNIAVKFTGCESLKYKCKSPGAAEGEIKTRVLAGTLRWETATKSKVAIDLVPQEGELFVEFQCGPANAIVKGSVMTNVPVNIAKTVFEQKFTATKGKQKPEFYYTASKEKIKDVLISKIGGPGAELEQSGQTVTNTQTDEEPLELNSKF